MPRPARLIGINHVALEVGDVDEALDFYGRLFEFELRGRVPGMAFVDMGDQFLALAQGRTAAARRRPPFRPRRRRPAGGQGRAGRGRDPGDPDGRRQRLRLLRPLGESHRGGRIRTDPVRAHARGQAQARDRRPRQVRVRASGDRRTRARMSFRGRLLVFFTIIVVIPMIAVALVLFSLTADSEHGKVDAQLASGLRTTLGFYAEGRNDARPVVTSSRPTTRSHRRCGAGTRPRSKRVCANWLKPIPGSRRSPTPRPRASWPPGPARRTPSRRRACSR